jgi:uncharacterized protein YegP (UPF0339 family)
MSTTSFEIYKDKAGHFRWKLIAKNGESVAEGGEGYAERRGVMNAVKKLRVWSATEKINDKTVEAKALVKIVTKKVPAKK